MNWGKGLAIAMGLFALLMVGFFISMMNTGSEEVPNRYYEKGNRYQEVIDEKAGAPMFGPSLSYDAPKKMFVLRFEKTQPDSGVATFVWPPDVGRNFSVSWAAPPEPGDILMEKTSAPEGFWNADVVMYKEGRRYRWQTRIWAK